MKKEIRERVYNKFNGHCAYCSRVIKYKDMQVDHIIPQYNFVQRITNARYHKSEKKYIPNFLEHLNEEDGNQGQ